MLELLALGEESMPVLSEKINRLTELFDTTNQLTDAALDRMRIADATGKGFAGRVHQTHQLALELEAPSEEIASLGQEYSIALANADLGIRALLDLADAADSDQRDSACELFNTMRDLAENSRTARDSHEELIQTLTESAQFSRALRPSLANMVSGVRHFADGHAVIEGWVARIDESPLDCSDWVPSPVPEDPVDAELPVPDGQ